MAEGGKVLVLLLTVISYFIQPSNRNQQVTRSYIASTFVGLTVFSVVALLYCSDCFVRADMRSASSRSKLCIRNALLAI